MNGLRLLSRQGVFNTSGQIAPKAPTTREDTRGQGRGRRPRSRHGRRPGPNRPCRGRSPLKSIGLQTCGPCTPPRCALSEKPKASEACGGEKREERGEKREKRQTCTRATKHARVEHQPMQGKVAQLGVSSPRITRKNRRWLRPRESQQKQITGNHPTSSHEAERHQAQIPSATHSLARPTPTAHSTGAHTTQRCERRQPPSWCEDQQETATAQRTARQRHAQEQAASQAKPQARHTPRANCRDTARKCTRQRCHRRRDPRSDSCPRRRHAPRRRASRKRAGIHSTPARPTPRATKQTALAASAVRVAATHSTHDARRTRTKMRPPLGFCQDGRNNSLPKLEHEKMIPTQLACNGCSCDTRRVDVCSQRPP